MIKNNTNKRTKEGNMKLHKKARICWYLAALICVVSLLLFRDTPAYTAEDKKSRAEGDFRKDTGGVKPLYGGTLRIAENNDGS